MIFWWGLEQETIWLLGSGRMGKGGNQGGDMFPSTSSWTKERDRRSNFTILINLQSRSGRGRKSGGERGSGGEGRASTARALTPQENTS